MMTMRIGLRIVLGALFGAVIALLFILGVLLCKGLAGSFIYSGF
jgi:hypothetical protein